MTRITRQQFQQQFANKELDVKNVSQDTRNELWRSGRATVSHLRLADINGDGKVSGAQEVAKLFDVVDDFDRNGTRHSIDTQSNGGQQTNAGKIYNLLSLQFAEAGNQTELPTGPNVPIPTPRPDLDPTPTAPTLPPTPPASTTTPQSDGTTTTTTTTTTPTTTPTTAPSEIDPTPTIPQTLGQRFAAGGAQSIDSKMSSHLQSIEESGVGLYYGDHSSLHGKGQGELQNWIDDNAIAGTKAPSASDLKESSCIGWAMENVGEAYKAAGKSDRWSQIKSIVQRDGMRGTTLAKELQKDGWESVYWNGDTANASHNGEHSYSAAMVKRGKPYYGIQVDHQVTNYEKGDMSGIDNLKEVPFFFGLARGGTHTFVGREGNVNEFHWSHTPDSKTAIEETPLKDWGWGSGLIMVPPGTWPR